MNPKNGEKQNYRILCEIERDRLDDICGKPCRIIGNPTVGMREMDHLNGLR